MIIKLTPNARNGVLKVLKDGECLVVNGERFDFSPLLDGESLPAAAINSEWFPLDVERVDGQLIIWLLLPHDSSAAESVRFPADIVNPPDGLINLPGAR
ncbi:hypothetical protein [Pseudomonas sp. St29]|uniref:hypothetical protein n=1 Tax=Pseudomonas sp. St29 TaxID=1500687 RepID=UPI0005FC5599|nr:hypothetical protein [Pseudomonas sp. St29]BAQ79146.1 uncharacterized protein PST29_1257 [Pseudomonas sp. St29]